MLLDGERQVAAQYERKKLAVFMNIMLKMALVRETVQRTS